MHTPESEHETDAEFARIAPFDPVTEKQIRAVERTFDAIFGVKCAKCGMTVDPNTHWHDDYRADTSERDDLQREAAAAAEGARLGRTIL